MFCIKECNFVLDFIIIFLNSTSRRLPNLFIFSKRALGQPFFFNYEKGLFEDYFLQKTLKIHE